MAHLPKHAKSVFKGVIFEVFQWDQLVYDGTVRTFEAVKRQESVQVLATTENKVILLKQKQPHHKSWYYDVIGGRMDVPGEKPKATALREMLEETGYKPKQIKLWKTFKHNFPVVDSLHAFIALGCKKVTEPMLDGGEIITVLELSYVEFLEYLDTKQMHKGILWRDLKYLLAQKNGKATLRKLLFPTKK